MPHEDDAWKDDELKKMQFKSTLKQERLINLNATNQLKLPVNMDTCTRLDPPAVTFIKKLKCRDIFEKNSSFSNKRKDMFKS